MRGKKRKRRRGGGYKKYRPVMHDAYEWWVWVAMHERFPNQICPAWRATNEGGGFACFVQDMGGFDARPRRTFLARTDRAQPFSPDNCFWKPRKVAS